MYLSATEAVINAIVHGNSNDINKNVNVTFLDKIDQYQLIIQDQGNGFDHSIIPDPTHHSNIKNESGRGIFIMKQYADKIFFKDNGKKIILIFHK